jgi:hypothetical protein
VFWTVYLVYKPNFYHKALVKAFTENENYNKNNIEQNNKYLNLKKLYMEEHKIRLFLFNSSLLSYVVIAAVLWIFEMNYCDMLLPYYLKYYGMIIIISFLI